MSKFIILSAGHGGTDPGAVGNGYKEHEQAWKFVKAVRDYLNTYYTGHTINCLEEKNSKGQFKSNAQYWTKDSSGGAYSFHLNASTSSSATGTEVLQGNFGPSRCNAVNKALAEFFTNRGVKEIDTSQYYLLREVGFDGIFEICFISNASDMKTFNSKFDEIVKVVAEVIASAEGLSKKSTGTDYPNRYSKAVKVDSYYDNPIKGSSKVWYQYLMNRDTNVYNCKTGKKSGTIKKGRNQLAYYNGKKNGLRTAKFYSNSDWHWFYTEYKN